jgi:riboflavin synthase
MYEVEVIAESADFIMVSEDEADSKEEAAEIAKERAQDPTRRGSDQFRLADCLRTDVLGPDEH